MNIIKLGLLSCCVALGLLISGFDVGHGYFEYRYYCAIHSNIRITITLKPEKPETQKCLYYIRVLDQNIQYYSEQTKIAQDNIDQGQFVDYRQSYLSEIQSKLLQSKVLHSQMIKVMNKFETELFQKTMLYISYRMRSTRRELEAYVQLRETAMINATSAGASENLQVINQKHLSERAKLDIINRILSSTNFNELMPLYTMYQQGKFD